MYLYLFHLYAHLNVSLPVNLKALHLFATTGLTALSLHFRPRQF
jgi:hypothetical protein